ncbi:MAG: ribosomal RNA small subunit methyltransferase A [Gemmatimonadetes bacterium]|nr:ribosomal RNA small subunit methyltransferase A [Gemmatimonadota bacterium]
MGRRLGQHFLADPAILDRIVDALDPRPDNVVIEIGAGEGSLTRRLAPRVGRVIAIEKDGTLADELRERGKGTRYKLLPDSVKVVVGDALQIDWHQLVTESTGPCSLFPFPAFKVVGNIPYYITSPLIEKALTPPLPSVVVFLLQREVADRLAARPGSRAYGALSVGVQVTARVERLFVVRAGAFRPAPQVDSAVVRLTPLERPLVAPEEHQPFRRFLAALFGQRRKQIGRSLRSVAGWSKEGVARLAQGLGLDPAARPEALAPEQLVAIFRAPGR